MLTSSLPCPMGAGYQPASARGCMLWSTHSVPFRTWNRSLCSSHAGDAAASTIACVTDVCPMNTPRRHWNNQGNRLCTMCSGSYSQDSDVEVREPCTLASEIEARCMMRSRVVAVQRMRHKLGTGAARPAPSSRRPAPPPTAAGRP